MRRPGELGSCCRAGYPTITPQLRTAIEKVQNARARALAASRKGDRVELERWLAVETRCVDELSAARVYPEELNHYIHAHRIGPNTDNPGPRR